MTDIIDTENDRVVSEDTAATAYDNIVSALVKDNQIPDALSKWSDDKKKDYVQLFKQRANVSQYILRRTAATLASKAHEKKFLGSPRYDKLVEDCNSFNGQDSVEGCGYNERTERWKNTYNRSQTDMDSIVLERVDSLLKNLPSLKKAILILDPDVAQKMEELELLKEKGQEITDKLNESSQPVKMSDLDQSMTIGAFLAYVKEMELKRKAWFEELNEIGTKGRALDTLINKALFKGVPGISDEIEVVVRDIYEKSKAMGLLARRVEEQVLYGDSDAAIALLSHFEKDETKLRDDIAERFKAGLEKLKLKVAKKKKLTETASE